MLRCVLAAGGENGFNQAIELAADSLLNVKFIREKKLLSAYFGEIAKDSGRYWYTPSRACHCTSARVHATQHSAEHGRPQSTVLLLAKYRAPSRTTDSLTSASRLLRRLARVLASV